jgi:hypothetical protein
MVQQIYERVESSGKTVRQVHIRAETSAGPPPGTGHRCIYHSTCPLQENWGGKVIGRPREENLVNPTAI